MKLLTRLLLLTLILLMGVGAINAQTNNESFESYLMRYINAINLGDYETAYAMIHEPDETFADFVAGYAETERIVPYFGFQGVAAGSTYITTVLLGFQTDDTVESYYGYYQLTYGAIFDPILNNGGPVLLGGQFKLVKDGEALHNTSIQTLLREEWDANRPIPADVPNLSAMSNIGGTLLLDYYDQINAQDYAGAYGWWLPDHRTPYERFQAGYGDTTYVTVYAGDVQAVTPNSLQALLVPAVLVSQHDDDTFTTYSGCYAMSYVNNTYKILQGKFTLLENEVPDAELVFDTLNTTYCAELLPAQ